jgi:WD40 repeat protein
VGLPPAGIVAHRTAVSFAPPPGALRIDTLGQHTWAVQGVAIHPDAGSAVTCGGEGLIVCHDLVSGFGLWNFKGFEFRGGPVAFSPDGQLLAAAGIQDAGGRNRTPDAVIHVLDSRTGRPLRRMEFRAMPFSLAWLPDNRHLLVGTNDGVRIWEVNEPSEINSFPITTALIASDDALSLAVDRAGRLLLVGTENSQNVRVLTLPEGAEKFTMDAHFAGFTVWRRNAVRSLAVSPNGQLAISGSNEGTARVWSVRTGEEICRFEGHAGWWGFRAVTGVARLPDGERALSACEDGSLCLWDARTGKELKRWDHGKGVRCLALSADGKVAVTGAWEGSLRVWHLS